MLLIAELRAIARARLDEAQVLLEAHRYDGAVYLCGYAVEMALKARICETLRWVGYPSTNSEFRDYQTFRTHDLDVLLRLSGVKGDVVTDFLGQWSAVARWNPDMRYTPIGTESEGEARSMIASATVLLDHL